MNWIAWMAALLVAPTCACGNIDPARLTVVVVRATPCDRPTARIGVGTVVGDDLVLTAAHIVEDDLRGLEVDGRPARVLALDARIDAAVLAVDTVEGRIDSVTDIDIDAGQPVRVITPTGAIETTVRRVVTLSVDDATDRIVHRRDALVLDGSVPAGTSGAPIVDGDERLVGMVAITHVGRDVTYATRTGELRSLVDPLAGAAPTLETRPSLAAQGTCA